MGDMTLPAEGGCRCGKIRIRLTRPAMLTVACHCTGCQTMTASAFSTSVTVTPNAFELTQGEPVLGGRDKTMHYFCGDCMTWMFTRVPGMDFFVNVRAMTLDDHSWFEPFVETFTSEMLPWAKTPAKHSYETFPADEEWGQLTAEYGGQR